MRNRNGILLDGTLHKLFRSLSIRGIDYGSETQHYLDQILCTDTALFRSPHTKPHYLLERDVIPLFAHRKSDKTKIIKQLSVQAAHYKLNLHFVKVQKDNEKFKEI